MNYLAVDAEDGTKLERPNPAIPHRTIGREGLGLLLGLADTEHIEVRDVDLLSPSYALEILSKGAPVARLDFHTKGWGSGSIFLVDLRSARLSGGSAQFAFRAGGRKVWMDAIEGLWEKSGEK
ncbi:MAG: hypothetical protein HY720_01340 [Planctomycetes bacterium]|nr:hypothetical protein [Planctomycetota bacterium]